MGREAVWEGVVTMLYTKGARRCSPTGRTVAIRTSHERVMASRLSVVRVRGPGLCFGSDAMATGILFWGLIGV